MCGCIERIDGELKAEGQCLDATMFGHRKATMMLIRTDKWIPESRRHKAKRIIANHCPFCGEKYPIEDRSSLLASDQLLGEK